MSFSYDSTLDEAKDLVRFLIGDTVDAGHLLEDEEINGALSHSQNSVNQAVGFCLRGIVTNPEKATAVRDRATGGLTLVDVIREWDRKAQEWLS